MLLGSLTIENFRGIKHATIPFHRKLTLLVGANNVGKSTVLDALAAILSYRRGIVPFSELDFHSRTYQDDLRKADPIKISLTLKPSEGTHFKSGELGPKLQAEIAHDNSEQLRLLLITKFDKTSTNQQLQSMLYRLEGDTEPSESNNEGSFPFRTEMPIRAFGIERDLGRGTTARYSPWGQMLAEIYPALEVLEPAMKKLREGSDLLIEKTEELKTLSEGLQKMAKVVGIKETNLSVAPEDLDSLMRQLFVVLTDHGSSRGFSGGRHGQGTQSVLLFGIYKAFTETLLKRAGAGELTPILTVEEPETHLHPVARRAMARQLNELPGQVIITTHSAELVAEVEPDQVVLLRAVSGTCQVGCPPIQDPRERRKLRLQAHALFAKTLIIAEGAEGEMLPVLADALGHDLSALGIELINAGGQDGIPGLYSLFHKSYYIPTVCIADADHKEKIVAFLNKAVPETATNKDDIAKLIALANTHNYYCSPVGMAIEDVMATEVPDLVDKYLIENEESDYLTWKSNLQNPAHPLKRQRKNLGELTEEEARSYRLAKYKTEFPRVIAGWLAKTPERIPSYLRQAIECAVALAKGE